MDNCKANKCIECTVTQCANHCSTSNYCALDCIRVGTHENICPMARTPDGKSPGKGYRGFQKSPPGGPAAGVFFMTAISF